MSEMNSIPERLKMLLIKLLGFKGFIWLVGTVFLWFGKITSTDWVLLSGGTGLLNVGQKYVVPKGQDIDKGEDR